MSERPVAISVENVSKQFGDVTAVDDVSLEIREGEFFTMLGPSGCGKTTTLRMIAGFEEPTEGRILLRGADVTDVPANRRNVNMVFQHYALFPHMSVYENVAFGLKLKKLPKDEVRERVLEMLEKVELGGMGNRRPQQLSGGQQQRVALARALVNRPAALLLDEPLGALDVKLRKQLQLELKRIQHEVGTTFVYVTHDQEEALSMSDRIAIMNRGVVEQVGSPREIYERPSTTFCADFIGSLNAIALTVDSVGDGMATASFGEHGVVRVPTDGGIERGRRVRVALRPERIRVEPEDFLVQAEMCWLRGELAEIVYLGALTQFHVDTPVGRVVSHRMNEGAALRLAVGSPVVLAWLPAHGAVLPEDELPA
jgi:spermidine/putrescine transport system ATP-binding protein